MKKQLLLFIYILVPILSIGQSDTVVEIDTITRQPKMPLPFDRPFFLKIKANERPVFIDYMENKKTFSWNKTIIKTLDRRPKFQFKPIPDENYELRAEGKDKYLYIKFDYHPYRIDKTNKKNDILKPSKRYTIVIPKFYDNAIEIFDEIHNNNSLKAGELIKKIKDQQLKDLGIDYLTLDNLYQADSIYDCFLRGSYLKIDSLESEISQYKTDSLLKDELYKNLIVKLSKCDTCLFTVYRDFDIIGLRNFSQNLYNLSSAKYSYVLLGKLSIDNLNADVSIINTYNQQISNLTKSQTLLNQMLRLIDYLMIRDGFVPQINELASLKNLNNLIEKNIKIIKLIVEYRGKIANGILAKKIYLEPTTVSGSSFIYNFETRSKFQITPDFGYVAYGFANGFSGFTPYLGFHINFRSIDKDIPFRLYPNKTLWHRLSFMTGWTLASVAESGKREDFFTKSSFLTGLGFRFTNALRLTFGAMWFYKDNPNPIIEQRQISTAFFTGLSIDLDVKKFLNGFTDLLPTKQL